MTLYICSECHAIENTSLGHSTRLHRNEHFFGDLVPLGMAVCSECAPATFKDGSKFSKGGKWHDVFPKEIATKEWLLKQLSEGYPFRKELTGPHEDVLNGIPPKRVY